MQFKRRRAASSIKLQRLQSYKGIIAAKEEPTIHPKGSTGKEVCFQKNHARKSFAAVLRGNPQQEQQPQQLHTEPAETTAPLFIPKPQVSDQSAKTPSVTTSSLDDLFKISTTAQQIKEKLNGSVSE
jgi:hypothetical protein